MEALALGGATTEHGSEFSPSFSSSRRALGSFRAALRWYRGAGCRHGKHWYATGAVRVDVPPRCYRDSDPGQCALAHAQPGFAFPGGPSFADVRRPALRQTMPLAPTRTEVITLTMLLIGVALILAALLIN